MYSRSLRSRDDGGAVSAAVVLLPSTFLIYAQSAETFNGEVGPQQSPRFSFISDFPYDNLAIGMTFVTAYECEIGENTDPQIYTKCQKGVRSAVV